MQETKNIPLNMQYNKNDKPLGIPSTNSIFFLCEEI